MTADPTGALAHRSTFETADGDQITGLLREQYVDNDIHFTADHEPAVFRFSTVETNAVAGDHLRSSIDYGGTCDPFENYLFYICRNGRMSVDTSITEQRLLPGDATFFPPGRRLDFEFHDLGLQALKLPTGRFEQIVENLTDVPAGQVRFDGLAPVSDATHQRWNATFAFVLATLDGMPGTAASALVTEQLSQLLVATAIDTFPNTAKSAAHHAGVGRVDPAAVRRATAYIDSHAGEAVTLADIADAAGTTGRAIQYAFRRHRDTTPMSYLRQTRLRRAHAELQLADPTRGATVAEIAARWGFLNPARFSTVYRAAYGQPPSRTLRS